MSQLAYNKEYELYVPSYEPRLMQKGWFAKTYKNLPRELALALSLTEKKRTVVQAGGCFGIFPKYFAGFFDRVITFEPNPVLCECIHRNTFHNGNIILYRMALGAKLEKKTFYQANKSGGDTLKPSEVGLYKDEYEVQVIPLDILVGLDDVDLIQLDIENYEDYALEGAKKIIEKCKPIIQVEMHVRSKDRVHGKLKELGYRFHSKAGSRDAVYVPI